MLLLAACPLCARSLEFGLSAPADLVSDDLVSLRGPVLVDQGSPCRGVAHAVHEFAERRARLTGAFRRPPVEPVISRLNLTVISPLSVLVLIHCAHAEGSVASDSRVA